jgi:two-component system NtrC family sensor kinase
VVDTATVGSRDEVAALRRTEKDLRRTVEDQRRTIDALIVAADRRTAAEPDSAALATWQRNLTLHRRLVERSERIRSTEQLLRAIIDSIEAGLCILDEAGRILDTNQVWHAMLAKIDEVAGDEPCFFNLAGNQSDGLGSLLLKASAAVRQVLAGQHIDLASTHRVDTSEGPRWWHLRVGPVRGHGAARVVLTLIDETAAVRAQDDLRQATRAASHLALVARHMDDAVVLGNSEGRIEWVNDAFTRMSGYTLDDVVGRLRTEFFGIDRASMFDFAAMADGESVVIPDFEARTKDGHSCWVRVELYRVVDDDNIVRVVAVERDVTARVKAERSRLAAKARTEALAHELTVESAVLTGVISAIPHLIYWKDAEGRYGGHNAAFRAVRGLARDADLTGRLEPETGVADDLAAVLADLEARVLEGGEPIVDHHVTITGAGGTPLVLLMSVLPRPEAGGVIGIGADVTHLSELERQLNQTNRLEAIGQLAAGIAHEINTPIQFISDNTRFVEQSFTELLTLVTAVRDRFGESDPELADLIRDVDVDFVLDEVPTALRESLEGLERVAQIVRAMKDFSHPGQGRSDVDLNRAVESTSQVARNEWKYHAELTLDLSPDVGLVACYEGELKQVILNLIVNAAHAVEAAGPRSGGGLGHIAIRTLRTPDTVEITIRDDGTGMDEATRQRIFDPFFTTKEVGKGTGQGLSMAYSSIVQKHGGAIRVDSSPGRGATFTIELPTRVEVEPE